VYEDIFDAKNACDHLSGFNVQNRYLVVLSVVPTHPVTTRSVMRAHTAVWALFTHFHTLAQPSSCAHTRTAAWALFTQFHTLA